MKAKHQIRPKKIKGQVLDPKFSMCKISTMELEIELSRTERTDGPLVVFGIERPLKHPRLSIPAFFERVVHYRSSGLTVQLTCEFKGGRVELVKLQVTPSLGTGLLTTDLTKLSLPLVIKKITYSVIEYSDYWIRGSRLAPKEWEDLVRDDDFLTQLVWLEHVSQGTPRNTLMSYFGMPRSSCSLLLKRLRLANPDLDTAMLQSN